MNSSVLAAVWTEINDARAQARPVVQIRVSQDALAGSVVMTPLTPERARALAPRVYAVRPDPTPVVVADPQAEDTWLEIVIHPQDLFEALRDPQGRFAVQNDVTTGGGMRIYGVPVVQVETAGRS